MVYTVEPDSATARVLPLLPSWTRFHGLGHFAATGSYATGSYSSATGSYLGAGAAGRKVR